MNQILELGAEGWLRQGKPWDPAVPFYGVLGDPVDHSLSPVMHEAALKEREIDRRYHAVRISAGQLRQLKEGPAGRLLEGFNVTSPLKEAVAALCDGRTEQARRLEAVNTVKVEEGRWLGHNTDSGGILSVLSEIWGANDRPAAAVVLGAGGVARASIDALLRWGMTRVVVRNRSSAGRRRILSWAENAGLTGQVQVEALQAGGEPLPRGSVVWVCCLAGGVSARAWLPAASGADPAFLLDLRYGSMLPPEDPPLGCGFADGKPVLLMQGGLSFTWWFGPPVPWSVMRDALTGSGVD